MLEISSRRRHPIQSAQILLVILFTAFFILGPDVRAVEPSASEGWFCRIINSIGSKKPDSPFSQYSKKAKELGLKYGKEPPDINHVQQAIWLRRETTTDPAVLDEMRSLQDHLAQFLREGELTSEKGRLPGSTTEVYWIKYKGEIVGVFKPHGRQFHASLETFEDPKHEVAAYEIDRMFELNIVPTTVMRKIKDREGSIQFFINDATEARSTKRSVDLSNLKSARNMRLLDYLIANPDRHSGNYLIFHPDSNMSKGLNGSDRIVAVDHAAAFSYDARDITGDLLYPAPNLTPERILQMLPDQATFNQIRSAAPEAIRERLKDYLSNDQMNEFIRRRDAFVKAVEEQQAQQGANFKFPE